MRRAQAKTPPNPDSEIAAKARNSSAMLGAGAAAAVAFAGCCGGAGCETGGVQSDLLVTGPLPHPQLFAHLAAVVHHGGAGTTATAARAGIPQIIVPHLLDQFFWAKRIRDLGLGPKGIPQSRLCSRSLARAITACLRIRQYGNRARQVGIRLRHQNGVARAVKIIESVGKEASRNAAGRSGE